MFDVHCHCKSLRATYQSWCEKRGAPQCCSYETPCVYSACALVLKQLTNHYLPCYTSPGSLFKPQHP